MTSVTLFSVVIVTFGGNTHTHACVCVCVRDQFVDGTLCQRCETALNKHLVHVMSQRPDMLCIDLWLQTSTIDWLLIDQKNTFPV